MRGTMSETRLDPIERDGTRARLATGAPVPRPSRPGHPSIAKERGLSILFFAREHEQARCDESSMSVGGERRSDDGREAGVVRPNVREWTGCGRRS